MERVDVAPSLWEPGTLGQPGREHRMAGAQGKAKETQDAHAEDGREQVLLTRELSSALTVMKGRTQLLRRRLRQGGDTARLEPDLNAIEMELARLTAIVEQINRGDDGG